MTSGNSLPTQLVLIGLLTLINAFFSGAEIAIISSNKKKLKKLKIEGSQKADILLEILKEPSKFLSTIQVGITFAEIGRAHV